MSVEITAEAAQFQEKECINGIAFAVYMNLITHRALNITYVQCRELYISILYILYIPKA
jgi:hypothetical protein